MTDKPRLVYFGWSCFSVETSQRVLLFDPFFRPECGAEWAHLEDFTRTNIICLTHGHHEHYLDKLPWLPRRQEPSSWRHRRFVTI